MFTRNTNNIKNTLNLHRTKITIMTIHNLKYLNITSFLTYYIYINSTITVYYKHRNLGLVSLHCGVVMFNFVLLLLFKDFTTIWYLQLKAR